MRTGLNGIVLAGMLALLGSSAAQADRLLIDAVRESAENRSDFPRQGQTKSQVQASLGAPEDQVRAVGEPPISRWVYADYTVYFEHDRVLHTVVKR